MLSWRPYHRPTFNPQLTDCFASAPIINRIRLITAAQAPVRVPHLRPPSPKQRADSLYIHSTEPGSGKALVSLGLLDLIQTRTHQSAKVGFFRPLISSASNGSDEDIDLVLKHFNLKQTFEESYGMRTDLARKLLGEHRRDEIIETIIQKYRALEAKCDFVLCEGRHGNAVEFNLNQELAKNLSCQILILGNAKDKTVAETMSAIQISIDAFEAYDADIVAIVVNKSSPKDIPLLSQALDARYKTKGYVHAVLPYEENLICPRIYDVVEALGGEVLYGKHCLDNRVSSSILGTMQLHNVLNWLTKDDCLMITSGDRGDIICGAIQAHRKRTDLGSSCFLFVIHSCLTNYCILLFLALL